MSVWQIHHVLSWVMTLFIFHPLLSVLIAAVLPSHSSKVTSAQEIKESGKCGGSILDAILQLYRRGFICPSVSPRVPRSVLGTSHIQVTWLTTPYLHRPSPINYKSPPPSPIICTPYPLLVHWRYFNGTPMQSLLSEQKKKSLLVAPAGLTYACCS